MRKFGRVLCVALLAAPVWSQQAADFAGVWRMDAERSESAHQAVPIGPVTMIVKATPAELSIETRRAKRGKVGGFTETLKYRLDGAENAVTDKSGAPVKTRARFEGGKLVTETTRTIQGSTVTAVQRFSLDPNGKELTIDKTLAVQHGYQSPTPDANSAGKGTDVFVRSAPRR